MKTYRVTLCRDEYYTEDICANSAEEAEKIMEKLMLEDPLYLDKLEPYDGEDRVVEGYAFEVED